MVSVLLFQDYPVTLLDKFLHYINFLFGGFSKSLTLLGLFHT